MHRRNFLKISGIAGGGVMLSFNTALQTLAKPTSPNVWKPNFFIKIDKNNLISYVFTKQELGQGVSTGLAMILADELGADFQTLKVEFAPGSPSYGNYQDTGGSNSIVMLWKPLREAAAVTREILIRAAAHQWKTSPNNCYTQNNEVRHRKNNAKKFRFCDLLPYIDEAKEPATVNLKPIKDFQLIGKSITNTPRNQSIAKGAYSFSLDKKLPDMRYVVINRSPVFGGKVQSFQDKEARKVVGVEDVFKFEGDQYKGRGFNGRIRQGVAIVANNTWAALKAKEKLKITWDEGKHAQASSESLRQSYEKKAQTFQKTSFKQGDTKAALAKATKKITATYENPMQAHALMEPLNAIAHFKGDSCEVWAGTQSPKMARQRIADITKLPLSKVKVNPLPSGGGFGRRYYSDFIDEAVLISKKIGKPVKLVWSREDTIQTSFYHHYSVDFLEAGLDEKNEWVALNYKGIFPRSYGYCNQPYDIPNMSLHRLPMQRAVPTASWRSVVTHIWKFVQESFVDEVAHAANKDPLKLRQEMLAKHRLVYSKGGPWAMFDVYSHRLKNVLDVVAQKANWGKKMPKKQGMGIACCIYNGSYCAQVAEVTVQDGELKVNKVTCVVDCGLVVNPSLAKNQIEGSILWGMSAVLYGGIQLKNGKVQQSNFHDFKIPRMVDAPEIEIHFIESEAHPTGIGEPAVPPVAPAILNAVFAATGKRIRKLPVQPKDLS